MTRVYIRWILTSVATLLLEARQLNHCRPQLDPMAIAWPSDLTWWRSFSVVKLWMSPRKHAPISPTCLMVRISTLGFSWRPLSIIIQLLTCGLRLLTRIRKELPRTPTPLQNILKRFPLLRKEKPASLPLPTLLPRCFRLPRIQIASCVRDSSPFFAVLVIVATVEFVSATVVPLAGHLGWSQTHTISRRNRMSRFVCLVMLSACLSKKL